MRSSADRSDEHLRLALQARIKRLVVALQTTGVVDGDLQGNARSVKDIPRASRTDLPSFASGPLPTRRSFISRELVFFFVSVVVLEAAGVSVDSAAPFFSCKSGKHVRFPSASLIVCVLVFSFS